MQVFNHKTLALAIGSMGVVSTAYGAGLDRSGQDVTAFLQDGTYAEAVYTYIDADISGHDNASPTAISTIDTYTKGNPTGDVAEAYDFFRFGVKADINDRFSVGVLYDEPFGAALKHLGDSNFSVQNGGDATISRLTSGRFTTVDDASNALVQAQEGIAKLQEGIKATIDAGGDVTALTEQLNQTVASARTLGGAINLANSAEAQQGQGTNVEIRTHNLTALVGAKLGENKNFQVYAGPAAQRLTGEVHLRGTAYQQATGYDARMSPDTALGWVAGVAYSKPEIALKAALTYRSDITHKTNMAETFPALGVAGSTIRDFSVTLPESYNLDFQTGVSPTMLLTAKVRYVPWSDFSIDPPTYSDTTGTSIVSYDKDQWSAEIGLGKKLSDKIAVSGSVGYDSGAGNPISTLGPIKGYHSVGLGVKYNVTPEWSVSLGGKYLKFGDGTATLPPREGVARQMAGQFDDNDGYIAGLKVAYHSK